MTSLRAKEERSGQQRILKLLSASPAMRISGPLLDQNDCSVAVAAARQCAKPNTEHRADERSLTDRPRAKRAYLPHLIAWEVTRSCHLNCKHCRAAARFGPYPNELSTEECFHFLDDVASFSRPIMILTGGEPMLREDIFDIAAHGSHSKPLKSTDNRSRKQLNDALMESYSDSRFCQFTSGLEPLWA